jgi:hypothetical protein
MIRVAKWTLAALRIRDLRYRRDGFPQILPALLEPRRCTAADGRRGALVEMRRSAGGTPLLRLVLAEGTTRSEGTTKRA